MASTSWSDPIEGITQEDIEAFAEKLEQWSNALTAIDQRMLRFLIAKAECVSADEVEGFFDRGYISPYVKASPPPGDFRTLILNGMAGIQKLGPAPRG